MFNMVTAVKTKPAALTKLPREHRWTYDEYQRLADLGFFFKHRVELLGGRIIEIAAQKDLHSASMGLCQRAVERAFGPTFWVRPGLPLNLDRSSGPEPAMSVVAGTHRDYVGTGHPKSALLVIEISDTTLRYNRQRKSPRYAKAGYADYWIVNLIARQVEIYRKPMADPTARLGWRYSDVDILTPAAQIAPLAAPGSPILVADLLP
jgi:Uma2 family endonuclease